MTIEVTSGAIATLLAEASRAGPEECCGLLLGHGRIELARPAANLAADRLRHFEIDPAALFFAHRAERAGELQLLGYYHSHPTGSVELSATDLASASGDGRVWAIVANGGIGWWRDTADGFAALSYSVVDG